MPAAYQYFKDEGDIFASAFVALLDGQFDPALSALDIAGSTDEVSRWSAR